MWDERNQSQKTTQPEIPCLGNVQNGEATEVGSGGGAEGLEQGDGEGLCSCGASSR